MRVPIFGFWLVIAALVVMTLGGGCNYTVLPSHTWKCPYTYDLQTGCSKEGFPITSGPFQATEIVNTPDRSTACQAVSEYVKFDHPDRQHVVCYADQCEDLGPSAPTPVPMYKPQGLDAGGGGGAGAGGNGAGGGPPDVYVPCGDAGTSPTCEDLGALCADNATCCSGVCSEQGACEACRESLEGCVEDAECCSGTCSLNACA